MKLETWLRIAGIPYEAAWPPAEQSPKGKIPFIEDDGALIGDSTLIIEHLKRTRGVDPDEGLSPAERAISLAFRRMIKENTYWVICHGRYRIPAVWDAWRRALASAFVPPGAPEEAVQQALAIADNIQKTVLEQMHAHGIGRHTDDEIHQIGIADVSAISDLLADKPFLFGDRATTADAAAYATMANLIDVPYDTPPARAARERPNLRAYCDRMHARYYGE
jgi:glutathione S-transferase